MDISKIFIMVDNKCDYQIQFMVLFNPIKFIQSTIMLILYYQKYIEYIYSYPVLLRIYIFW